MEPSLGDEPGGLCVGCLRSIDEIIAWGGASDDDKRSILLRIEARRNAMGART
jgi:predicted Fe-S protein YdhL (DUF1289 family)